MFLGPPKRLLNVLRSFNYVYYTFPQNSYTRWLGEITVFFTVILLLLWVVNPAAIYLPKVKNRNTRTRCSICSKLTTETSERRHWRWLRSSVFTVNSEHISHLVLVLLLLTLSMQLPAVKERISIELSATGWPISGIIEVCEKMLTYTQNLQEFLKY